MARRIACVLVLTLAGCAGVSDLSTPATPALGDRSGAVRAKADAAVKEGKYADAWNLEAQAGSDRDRLEAIALASLEADRGPYEDMLKALRTKFGGLTPAGRAKVDALVRAKEGEGRFEDAVGVELVAADDVPTYQAAWALYERTPVKDALGVLEKIQKARKDATPDGSPK